MKVGSYMLLNDVIVLAWPERVPREKCESGGAVIQSNIVKKIVRVSRKAVFVAFVCRRGGGQIPNGRDLGPQSLVAPGPSNRSCRFQNRDH